MDDDTEKYCINHFKKWEKYWDKCAWFQGKYFEENKSIIALGRLPFSLILNNWLLPERSCIYWYTV